MREVAEKWKKTATEDENNAENSADTTSKHRERCHWLPGALIGCVRGNVARVRDVERRVDFLFSFIHRKQTLIFHPSLAILQNCPETQWQTSMHTQNTAHNGRMKNSH